MHALAVQLAPILGAEKSKTPFYIAGGVLVVWAFVLALGIGHFRPKFPTNSAGERLVIAISVVLVAATLVAAVATSGVSEKTESAAAAGASRESAPAQPSPPQTTSTSAPATSPPAKPPSNTVTTPATPSQQHQPAPKTTKLALSVPGTQLAYNTKQLTATAGTVAIALTNGSPLEHNVTIAEGAKVLGTTPTFVGGTKTVTLNLKPGKYTFYCSVPGHRQAGMEGTLTVK